jgi:hypothetical protein
MKCENIGCDKETELRADKKSYKKYCCNQCRIFHSHLKSVKTRLSRRPPEWEGSNSCKVCGKETYLTKKGRYAKYCSESCKKKGIVDSITKTCLEKYGVKNVSQNDKIKSKIKETFNSIYNGHPAACSEIQEKIKKTNLEKYGVEHSLSSDIVKEKIRKTNLEKYGVENASQKNIPKESLIVLDSPEKLAELFSNNSITKISSMLGVNIRTVKLRLIDYGIYEIKNSSFEAQILNYLDTLSINYIKNSRSIIPPLEVDIYIPEHNISIECNGSYWHSELNGKDKNYHKNKSIMCMDKNIELIHIWEHEWENKTEIIKSILSYRLRKSQVCIHARKCNIYPLNADKEREFFENNHIQGYVRSSVCFGLFHNEELVSAMSFGKSRFSKNYDWELLRFCNKNFSVISGSAGRLFNYFINERKPLSVISYSHRDKFTGKIYEKLGFRYSHSSAPSYYYTKDYNLFENRVKYQKHKLEKLLPLFDPSKTEWENMMNNGYDRIWDCGNDVWLWNK